MLHQKCITLSTSCWRQSEVESGHEFSWQVPINKGVSGFFWHGSEGMNMRFHHCFTDEDAMRWTKLLARKANPPTFEQSVLKKSISRLAALKNHRRLLFAKRSAGRRAQRDAKRS